MIKINTHTQHTLSLSNSEFGASIKVDNDGTAKLYLPTSGGEAESQWLSKNELATLRALITKALSLMS